MQKILSTTEIFNKLQSLNKNLKLTELRKAVLKIIIHANKPISAYSILEKLKKQRDSAEPPTVYRVIEYLIEKSIIHKVSTENKYVLCSQLENKIKGAHGILFLCKNCLASYEISDNIINKALKTLANNHQFNIDDCLIEVNGLCKQCVAYEN